MIPTSLPKFCWHCGKKLQLPYYAVVTDPLGYRHRVHKCCKTSSEAMQRQTAFESAPTAVDYDNDCAP